MTKTALITGATGGLGRAFTAALHERGYSLILTGRSTAKLATLSQTVTGSEARIVAADLNTPEGIATVVEAIRESPLDLLVNNAGFGTHGNFADLDLDRELAETTVNITALMSATHAALQGMRERGSGNIINVASVAGFQPLPYMATYGASKAFVDSFSLAVGAEARKFGVHVTSVCPGPVETNFFRVAGSDAVKIGKSAKPEDVVKAALAASDKGRARVVLAVGISAPVAVGRGQVGVGLPVAPVDQALQARAIGPGLGAKHARAGVLPGQLGRRALEDDLSVAHHQTTPCHLQRDRQLLLDQQHRNAAALQ